MFLKIKIFTFSLLRNYIFEMALFEMKKQFLWTSVLVKKVIRFGMKITHKTQNL